MKTSIDYLQLRESLPKGMQMHLPESVLNRWEPGLRAEADDDVGTISILDVIGQDFWGEGVTPKRIAGALRNIGTDKPVVVTINSPGGDMFDGLAIHSLLADHKGKVTVKVLGLAASAASVIAMAADEILIAKSGFLMIHNAWMLAAGDRNDFRDLANWLEPFDHAMRDLYADRTGAEAKDIESMLNDETWIGATKAIELGFAEATLDDDPQLDDEPTEQTAAAALRKVDAAMAKGGLARGKRRELLNTLKAGTPSAARGNDTPSAIDNAKQVQTLKAQIDEIRGLFHG